MYCKTSYECFDVGQVPKPAKIMNVWLRTDAIHVYKLPAKLTLIASRDEAG